ncbi:synaptotagmin-2 isoform X1 [Hydra vulgaris]|uniref:synaptotagmin-2 isoform X1 n=1 Tax=Hydra vulgaris TaxID=6087 RepID=UPI0001927197|nr:synaptotagmin-2 isoform X1 [Hydra vulgaris]
MGLVSIDWNEPVNAVKAFFEKNKISIILGSIGVVVLLVVICVCCKRCRRKRKKNKNQEKIKLKGLKPSKKLMRIQPNKNERKAMEELGTINFSLQYDIVSEMLTVKVIETSNVPVRDISGYAYAFVVIKLMPFHENEETEYKTRLVRATFWPAFGDLFTFIIKKEELSSQVLYFYQYELNRWSKHDGVGICTFDLKSVNFTKEKGEEQFSRKLRQFDPLIGLEVETGAVFLGIDYDREEWKLKVTVKRGDIVPMKLDQEKASTYVSLSILNGQDELLEKNRTDVQKGSIHPIFDQEIFFQVPDEMLGDMRLVITLKCKKLLTKSQVIGLFKILPTNEYWKQLIETGHTEGWFSVFSKPKSK